MPPGVLAGYLLERLEDRAVDHVIAYGQLTVTVMPAAVPAAVQLCRDDPRLGFDFFDFLCGVDEREDGFAVVIHLYSIRHRHHVQIRALAEGGRDAPHLPTISHLYAGANWHERETYDMYGITFDGHPGLLPRILTVENFEGFPLRKDFLLMTREVKPWPGLKEPMEVTAGDGDGDADQASAGPSAEEKARSAQERADRAKAKAAEARRRRARETAGDAAATDDETGTPSDVERPAGAGEAGAEKEAALAAGSGDDEIAGDPRSAAEVSDTAIAKDAAAGAVAGDTAAGAPGDEAGVDEPVEDLAREAEIAGGGPPRPSGTPGVEAEGRHVGARDQSGSRPPADTPGMTSDTQEHEVARHPDETPAPPGDDGSSDLPPEGPGQEEPRALADDADRIETRTLGDETGPEVGPTRADRPEQARPLGTDADDRLRDLEANDDEDGER